MSGGLFTNMLLREIGVDIDQARIERLRRLHARAFNARSCRVRPLPGAPELLRYLTRTGITWAIATSGRMETAGPVLDSLEVDLSHIPVITRDLVERAKPDPDLFLAAADALKVDIATACVVGDSIWDMLAARRAGALGVGPCPEDTAATNWSAAAPIVSTRTRPTCCGTSTKLAVESELLAALSPRSDRRCRERERTEDRNSRD